MSRLTPLKINGSSIFESPVYGDERGYFSEWFKASLVNELLGK